jgi:LacI family transcriptional regulator
MLRNGRKKTTLKDVAKAVGVHVSTVSRALDERTRHMITAEVADKIIKVSRELNYSPNAAAYSLRTNRTRLIGVIIPDLTNPIFPPIIRGIEDALGRRNYIAVVVNTDGAATRESALINTLRGREVDGLIVASVERQDKAIDELADAGIAVVTVNRRVDSPHVSSVVNNEHAGMRRVLTHLISLGHSRIVGIAGPQGLSTGKIRHEAFEHFRKKLGLAGDPGTVVFANAFNEDEGERCMETLLARDIGFSAVVASNDRLAIGALTALKRHGIDCPAQVSVTGFNDMYLADRIDPPLTTVRIQQYEVGLRAAEALLRHIDAGDKLAEPVHDVLPVDLVVRQSTAPLARL